MDLRTKLIFAFVGTALASMLLLGWFSYVESRDMLRDSTARQLEALASARAGDLAVIVQALEYEVGLIRSRTQLRRRVEAYPREPEVSRPVVQEILDDAQSGIDHIRAIAVFDIEGELIARTGVAPNPSALLGTNREGRTATRFYEGPGMEVTAELQAPLELEGRVVGSLAAEVEIGRLVRIGGNYEGLGETGEMLLVTEFEPGRVTFLGPLRHRETERLLVLPKDEASEAVRMALTDRDTLMVGTLDYRGVPVWAAVEGMPDLSVGLVVKVDEEEELAPIRELRSRLLRVGLSAAALAILMGALFGAVLARPIRDLWEVVRGIRDGNTGLRAKTRGEDEVSFLAECFNKLMDDVHGPATGATPEGEEEGVGS